MADYLTALTAIAGGYVLVHGIVKLIYNKERKRLIGNITPAGNDADNQGNKLERLAK